MSAVPVTSSNERKTGREGCSRGRAVRVNFRVIVSACIYKNSLGFMILNCMLQYRSSHARRLAQEGAKVIVSSRKQEKSCCRAPEERAW